MLCFLYRWLRRERSSAGAKEDLPRGFGVIKQRPEQSKHLETATMQLRGFHIDFVNLRSETYAEDSRIPSAVALGTPLEDTLRRDYACNALFFNLRTRRVEDWSGKGIADVFNKHLRTPLENAQSTFLDDPLRVLRGVRFAATLNFTLDQTVGEAAASAATRAALKQRVSRERVGIEFEKMMKPKRRVPHGAEAAAAASHQDDGVCASSASEASKAASLLSPSELGLAVASSLRAFLLLQQLGLWSCVACAPPDCAVCRLSGLSPKKDTQSRALSGEEFSKESSQAGLASAAIFVALKALLLDAAQFRAAEEQRPAAVERVLDSWDKVALSVHLDAEGAMLLSYAAAFLPLSDFAAVGGEKSKKEEPLPFKILSLSLKQPTRVCKAVEGILKAARVLKQGAAEALLSPFGAGEASDQRVRVGCLVREAGEHWALGLLLAAAQVSSEAVQTQVAEAVQAAAAALKETETDGLSRSREGKRPLNSSPLPGAEAKGPPEKTARACVSTSVMEEPRPEERPLGGAPKADARDSPSTTQEQREQQQEAAGAAVAASEKTQDARSATALQEVDVSALERALVSALAEEGQALRLLEALAELRVLVRDLDLKDAHKLTPLCDGKQARRHAGGLFLVSCVAR